MMDHEDKERILKGESPHRLDLYPDEAECSHWNRNFEWEEEKDEINPCRPPPGWRLLDAFEFIEVGDLYWHTLDKRWYNTNCKPVGTPYFTGHPYARRIQDTS
jgi:hypothetical protein